MYTNNRDAYRQFFFTTWQKYEKKLPLEPTEMRLITVILKHPEYQRFLENPGTFLHQEFAPEENPFFHMSLHYALSEQIDMNRPEGIRGVWEDLKAKHESEHEAEHLMMGCLTRMMADAQKDGVMKSDAEYLEELRKLLM